MPLLRFIALSSPQGACSLTMAGDPSSPNYFQFTVSGVSSMGSAAIECTSSSSSATCCNGGNAWSENNGGTSSGGLTQNPAPGDTVTCVATHQNCRGEAACITANSTGQFPSVSTCTAPQPLPGAPPPFQSLLPEISSLSKHCVFCSPRTMR